MKTTSYLVKVFFVISLWILSVSMFAQYRASWESLDKRPTPAWWTDAKFGIDRKSVV